MWTLKGNIKGPPGESPLPVTINQPVPRTEWVIDLGQPVQVVVLDSSGRVVEPGTITYAGSQVTLEFSIPLSGKALCFA